MHAPSGRDAESEGLWMAMDGMGSLLVLLMSSCSQKLNNSYIYVGDGDLRHHLAGVVSGCLEPESQL